MAVMTEYPDHCTNRDETGQVHRFCFVCGVAPTPPPSVSGELSGPPAQTDRGGLAK